MTPFNHLQSQLARNDVKAVVHRRTFFSLCVHFVCITKINILYQAIVLFKRVSALWFKFVHSVLMHFTMISQKCTLLTNSQSLFQRGSGKFTATKY